MMYGSYTGWDGNVWQQRCGTETFAELLCQLSDHVIVKTCSWEVRKMKNPRVQAWSVHGTGRACDFSWEDCNTNYEEVKEILDFLVFYSELFLIEEIHDYFPQPFGRGWRCDRSKWKDYNRETVGEPAGCKKIHIEISPAHADDQKYYEEVFLSVIGQGLIPFSKPIEKNNIYNQPSISKMLDNYKLIYPNEMIKLNDSGVYVEIIQEKINVDITSEFDVKTENKIKEIQKINNINDTGLVDKQTWQIIFGRNYDYPGYEIGPNNNDTENVILIQNLLGIKPDGIYGLQTIEAVKKWQHEHALEFVADGIVGERTWKAMFGQ